LTDEKTVEETMVEFPETEEVLVEEVEVDHEESDREKLEELNRRYLRVCADFDNFRRRRVKIRRRAMRKVSWIRFKPSCQ